jgi:exosortase K
MKTTPKLIKNSIYYGIAILLFVLLKFAHSQANTAQLDVLLNPTSRIISFLTGFQMVHIPESGYYFEQLDVLINKSCSGFNFWVLCSTMLIFLMISFWKTSIQKIMAMCGAFMMAYLLTILVNSSRIFASILIQSQELFLHNINPKIIHEAIGIANNLISLILIYLLAERLLTFLKARKSKKMKLAINFSNSIL